MKKRYITPKSTAIDLEGEIMQNASITTQKISGDGPVSKEVSSNPAFREPATAGGGAVKEDLEWGF